MLRSQIALVPGDQGECGVIDRVSVRTRAKRLHGCALFQARFLIGLVFTGGGSKGMRLLPARVEAGSLAGLIRALCPSTRLVEEWRVHVSIALNRRRSIKKNCNSGEVLFRKRYQRFIQNDSCWVTRGHRGQPLFRTGKPKACRRLGGSTRRESRGVCLRVIVFLSAARRCQCNEKARHGRAQNTSRRPALRAAHLRC